MGGKKELVSLSGNVQRAVSLWYHFARFTEDPHRTLCPFSAMEEDWREDGTCLHSVSVGELVWESMTLFIYPNPPSCITFLSKKVG